MNTGRKRVLITGGSSGIGYEIALKFAKNDYELILVSQDRDRLEQSATELRQAGAVVITVPKNLSFPGAAQEIYDEMNSKNKQIDVLVNNAGFATHGPLVKEDLAREAEQINVNIMSLTQLTRLFLPGMIERGSGAIVNIASTAAFFPGPYMAVYYASKAYVLSFSQAIAEEVRGTGVTVTVICPGPTATRFASQADIAGKRLFKRMMNPADVASAAYSGMEWGRHVVIPGFTNKLIVAMLRLVPRSMVPGIVRRVQE